MAWRFKGPTCLAPACAESASPSTPGQRRAGCFLLLVWAQQWVQQFGAPPSGPLRTNYVVLTPSRRQRSTGATGCRTLQMSDGGDSFRCLDIWVVILCSLSSDHRYNLCVASASRGFLPRRQTLARSRSRAGRAETAPVSEQQSERCRKISLTPTSLRMRRRPRSRGSRCTSLGFPSHRECLTSAAPPATKPRSRIFWWKPSPATPRVVTGMLSRRS